MAAVVFIRLTKSHFEMFGDELVGKGSLLFYDEQSGDSIVANNRSIVEREKASITVIKLPFIMADIFGFSRRFTRLFRLDRVNLLYKDPENLVFLRYKSVYHFCKKERKLTQSCKLKITRNILVNSSTVGPDNEIVFGDYGASGKYKGVGIHRSFDFGRHWEKCFIFPIGLVKQVLAVRWDSNSSSYWVNTGDENGECFFWRFDKNFLLLEKIGDGSLTYRAISSWFSPGKLLWVTNDPYSGSQVFSFELSSQKLNFVEKIDGSVWYATILSDGWIVLASCAEELHWNSNDGVTIFVAKEYRNFQPIRYYPKDRYHKDLFRFGLCSFPQGNFSSEQLKINLEAVKNYDGNIIRLNLKSDLNGIGG